LSFELPDASPKVPKQVNTLGNHIRKYHLDLNLLQQQVADWKPPVFDPAKK
jgi:hypothetical protein